MRIAHLVGDSHEIHSRKIAQDPHMVPAHHPEAEEQGDAEGKLGAERTLDLGERQAQQEAE